MKINIGDQVFGDWTVTEWIGDGSFSLVYRIERKKNFGAKDSIQKCALKVISPPRGLQKQMRDLILNEVALMDEFKGHTNIVYYDNHEEVTEGEDWSILIQMELLENFFDYENQNPLSVDEIVQMGIDISSALALCHEKHVFHRDVKPQNIFHSEFGYYKLGDFGSAVKSYGAEFDLAGTYPYIAPEIVKHQGYDHRADIFSLGLVLYQYLNGNTLPFMSEKAIMASEEDTHKVSRMLSLGTDLPMLIGVDNKLEQIVRKACAVNPNERYQTASELKEDLQSYQTSRGNGKTRGPKNPGIRLNGKVAALGIGAAVLLAGSGFAGALLSGALGPVKGLKSTIPDCVNMEAGSVEFREVLASLDKAGIGYELIEQGEFLDYGKVVAQEFDNNTVRFYWDAGKDFTGWDIEDVEECMAAYGWAVETSEMFSSLVDQNAVIDQTVDEGNHCLLVDVNNCFMESDIVYLKGTSIWSDEYGSALAEMADCGVIADTSLDNTIQNDNFANYGCISGIEVESNYQNGAVHEVSFYYYPAPNFVGQSYASASSQITNMGWTVLSSEGYDSTRADGVVLSQTIDDSSRTVALKVNKKNSGSSGSTSTGNSRSGTASSSSSSNSGSSSSSGSSSGTSSQYPDFLTGNVLPESYYQVIPASVYTALSFEQLRYAVQELYARHGYAFPTCYELYVYYSQFSWYKPTDASMETVRYVLMTEAEMTNCNNMGSYYNSLKRQ